MALNGSHNSGPRLVCQEIERRTQTDTFLFICVNGLFQKVSMFTHCPQAMSNFFFNWMLLQHTLWMGNHFFVTLKKKIPRSH